MSAGAAGQQPAFNRPAGGGGAPPVWPGSALMESLAGCVSAVYADTSVTDDGVPPNPQITAIVDEIATEGGPGYSGATSYNRDTDADSFYGSATMQRANTNTTFGESVQLGQSHMHKATFLYRGRLLNELGLISSVFNKRHYVEVTSTLARWTSGNNSNGYTTASIAHGVDTADPHTFAFTFSQSINNYLRMHLWVDGVNVGFAQRNYFSQTGGGAGTTTLRVDGVGANSGMLAWGAWNRTLGGGEIASLSS